MKALVYRGPGKKAWADKDKPAVLKPTDAVVRVTHTTIRGTDLHILKGDVPEVPESLTLGHEASAWSRRSVRRWPISSPATRC